MSKIAKRVISIPQNVKINFQKGTVFAEGPLGKSEELFIPQEMEITNNEGKIITKSENDSLAGTYNSLIYNMIKGVTEGYEDILEVKGIGYKVSMKGEKLEFSLGKSHLDYVDIPSDLSVKVEGGKITVKGLDKQKVRSFTANDIRRSLGRMPSIYKKSKGIYYLGEEGTMKLKASKALGK